MPSIISWNTQGAAQKKLSESYNDLLAECGENVILIQEGGSISQGCNKNFTQFFGKQGNMHKFTACFF